MFFLSRFAQYMYTTIVQRLVGFIINFVLLAAISLKGVYRNTFLLYINTYTVYLLQYFMQNNLTALHHACCHGHLTIVKMLVEEFQCDPHRCAVVRLFTIH